MTSVKSHLLASIVVCGILSVASPVVAQAPVPPGTASTAKPDVADLLFGNPQWSAAPIGSTITYRYTKTSADPVFGAPFDDTVNLTLDKGDTAERRTVVVKMFTGANTKPAGPFDSTAQNPVLLLILEENVQELSKLFKGNPRYIKNAIRTAWREKAEITPVTITVGGKPVAGTRIAIQPFLNDPERDKMMGLDTMTYVVELADSIPGQIATIDISGPAGSAPKFSEVLRYQAEVKP